MRNAIIAIIAIVLLVAACAPVTPPTPVAPTQVNPPIENPPLPPPVNPQIENPPLPPVNPQLANPTIADIIDQPQQYEGRTVMIKGQYYGWGGGDVGKKSSSAMVTRSDTVIYDGSGCMFMSGVKLLSGGLDVNPTNKSTYGTAITIVAKVTLINGKPVFTAPPEIVPV